MTNIGWRMDRQVTLGLLLAIVLETAGALLWAGRTAERVERLEAELKVQAPVAERLARLEEQSLAARITLDRIERKLESKG